MILGIFSVRKSTVNQKYNQKWPSNIHILIQDDRKVFSTVALFSSQTPKCYQKSWVSIFLDSWQSSKFKLDVLASLWKEKPILGSTKREFQLNISWRGHQGQGPFTKSTITWTKWHTKLCALPSRYFVGGRLWLEDIWSWYIICCVMRYVYIRNKNIKFYLYTWFSI